MMIAPSSVVLILAVGRLGSCILSRHLEFWRDSSGVGIPLGLFRVTFIY